MYVFVLLSLSLCVCVSFFSFLPLFFLSFSPYDTHKWRDGRDGERWGEGNGTLILVGRTRELN